MTGFEARIYGVGGDCSTNWATTTAPSSQTLKALRQVRFHPSIWHFKGERWSLIFPSTEDVAFVWKKKLFWIFVDFFLIDFLTFLKEKKVWKLIFLKVFSFPQSGFKNFSPFFQFFFLGDAAENHFGTFSIKNILASILWAVYKLVF